MFSSPSFHSSQSVTFSQACIFFYIQDQWWHQDFFIDFQNKGGLYFCDDGLEMGID